MVRFGTTGRLVGLLLLALLIYLPGVHGTFIFDDLANITQNQKIVGVEPSFMRFWQAVWSVESGPLQRPVAMASFTLNAWIWGIDSFSFKLTNIFLHLINILLVFAVSRQLYCRLRQGGDRDNSTLAALICAAFFALHPINFTSVLYVVQRMTSLATAFMLLALWCQLRLSTSQSGVRSLWWVGGYFAFTALGILSKENALLVVPISLLIEFCLRDKGRSLQNTAYRHFFAFLVVANVIGLMLFLWKIPGLANSYGDRPYTMIERLWTESRVVFFYLFEIFIPRIRDMSLFHDDFVLSSSLFEPFSTLYSTIGIIALAGLFVVSILKPGRHWRVLALVIGWFFIGHALESSVIPLELVYDHRNHFPMIGIGLGVGYFVTILINWRTRYKVPIYGTLILWFGLLASLTALRAESWRSADSTVVAESSRQPHSPRAQEAAANYYSAQVLAEGGGKDHPLYAYALKYFNASISANPGSITGLIGVIEWHQKMGVEGNPNWTDWLANRLNTQKFHGYELGRLVELMICQVDGFCRIPAQEFSRWVSAILDNPGISLARKAMIANTATGLAVSYGLPDIAMYYAQKALEWAPEEVEFMVTLAILAHRLNKIDIRDAAIGRLLRHSPSPRAMERLQEAGIVLSNQEGLL